MAKDPPPAAESIQIDLKDRWWALTLAWLIPGAGHLYQGRKAKAAIFFVCIMGTFIYGMLLGEGRVVYAQWNPPKMRRWACICQIGVGLPSLPAIAAARGTTIGGTDWYVPPDGRELDELQERLNRQFELGTVFTMIAGLLNVLAMFDAWGGPAFVEDRRAQEKSSSRRGGRAGRRHGRQVRVEIPGQTDCWQCRHLSEDSP